MSCRSCSPRRRRLGWLAALTVAVVALVSRVSIDALAPSASAEEAIVLDNGAILRGNVLKDDGENVVFALAGIGNESRVTVEKSRIVQRFQTIEPRRTAVKASADAVPMGPTAAVRVIEPVPLVKPAAPPLPAEEPRAHDEDFFSRTARRAALALPSEAAPRAFLGSLAVVVVLCLILLSGRMVDVQGVTLGKATALAVLFLALVALNFAWSETALRADWAPMFVPIEILAWVGCASGLLRCGFGRAFSMLAFVVLSAALVVFSTGVVLVSV